MGPEIRVPGSKSVTQRALILAALADGPTGIRGGLDCDDSRLLRAALRAMGVAIEESAGDDGPCWLVRGGTLRPPRDPVHCGNAGTTIRFAAALSLLLDGPLTLDGDERMRRRPLGDLADALGALGVDVRWHAAPGFPPLTLRRRAAPGDRVEVDASRSSQFASALLLVAPRLARGLILRLASDPVSRPYVYLTISALRTFGARADVAGAEVRVEPGGLCCSRFDVEADWSSAAFLLAAGWILGRTPRLAGLRDDSAQGDRAIVDLLRRLDDPAPRTFDLRDGPDLIAPLAAAAVFADGPSEIVGVAHARIKESDRIAVLAAGLRAAGATVVERPDGLWIEPGLGTDEVELDPHDDHRMAMAFGLLGLRNPRLRVRDRSCVSKSYPAFWEDLDRLSSVTPDRPGPGLGPRAPSLFLIGPRGSGKTSVGRILAGRLGVSFVDADVGIARRAGLTVAEIFARHGEAHFRRMEHDVMVELLGCDGLVVGTGGGCVLDAEVRAGLRRLGTAIWLDAAPEVRAVRIAGSDRPPLTAHGGGPAEEAEVARAREALYRECAAVRVATDERTPEEVADDVERVRGVVSDHDVR